MYKLPNKMLQDKSDQTKFIIQMYQSKLYKDDDTYMIQSNKKENQEQNVDGSIY